MARAPARLSKERRETARKVEVKLVLNKEHGRNFIAPFRENFTFVKAAALCEWLTIPTNNVHVRGFSSKAKTSLYGVFR